MRADLGQIEVKCFMFRTSFQLLATFVVQLLLRPIHLRHRMAVKELRQIVTVPVANQLFALLSRQHQVRVALPSLAVFGISLSLLNTFLRLHNRGSQRSLPAVWVRLQILDAVRPEAVLDVSLYALDGMRLTVGAKRLAVLNPDVAH